MPELYDAVIVGGGPAGSSAAIHLARSGLRVALLDRARFPRNKCCSEYGSPATVRELAALGVLGSLETGATALSGTTVHAARGATITGSFALTGGTPFRDTGLALPRHRLDGILLQAAAEAGVTVHQQTTLADLSRDSDGNMTALMRRTHRDKRLRGRVIIGADGLRSTVARRAGLARRGGLQRVAFTAHVASVRDMTDGAELHVGESGYVGLNPLGEGIANVALVVPIARARRAGGNVNDWFFNSLEEFPGVRGRVDSRLLTDKVMATGPFDRRCRSSTADGVLLVGDAADFFDPFTGEGIWAALTGGRMAAEVLLPILASSNPVTNHALAGYRRARRQRFAGKWLVERAIGHAMRVPRLFNHLVDRIDHHRLADTMLGVTADILPARAILNPGFLARMVH